MRQITLAGAAAGLLLLLAACGPVTEPGNAAPAGGRASASATAPVPSGGAPSAGSTTPAAATTTATVAATKTGATLVPMQRSTGGSFLSPSGNISCEIHFQDAGLTEAYCQTFTPASSVRLDATGTYRTCTEVGCIGNPGEGTPTLAYGQVTGVGPFRCESATTGVTCTANGKGFHIDNTGITAARS
ncbi:hypothetical protein [Dactylosporangium matsuzakiense]|uniref:Uncharacterized protein n=1 Tax=Dactylosporangium matsuzakiense TaxID=53360 RepID=A0A9W6NQ05_9ACTN|nr:hypothetical protein [Dactylosporangium matsuzakiense]UWZ41314.1 hypothetical protein Dmats_26960 [Dactylosporangium matsuzakiense]GLL05695.1 hypothetical protein GCM10017581_074420 [Dactylosporangium matsuzakiense]